MLFYNIHMQEVSGKGRGMFCLESIPKDEIIEIAPVIVMSSSDRVHLDKTLLHDYIFEWQPKGQQFCCMALGYIPIYNHSYMANCEYFMDYEAQTIMIKSVKPIEAGEELTINYNGDWNDEKKVWFDTVE